MNKIHVMSLISLFLSHRSKITIINCRGLTSGFCTYTLHTNAQQGNGIICFKCCSWCSPTLAVPLEHLQFCCMRTFKSLMQAQREKKNYISSQYSIYRFRSQCHILLTIGKIFFPILIF